MSEHHDPVDRLAVLRPSDLAGDVLAPPAAEVRARGDRLRRRRYAAAAGGAALAVALVLTPLALLSPDGQRSAPGPATTSSPSPSPTASAAADGPRPLLAAADLPVVDRPGVGAWREVRLDQALPTLDCVPARGLAFERPPTEWLTAQGFSLDDGSGTVLGRARVAAYRFADEPAAAAAAQRAREALAACPGLPDATGDAPVGTWTDDLGVEGATGLTREVVHGAPEVCAGDCDAAWFDHQSVVRLGDTLVLVSWAEVGGPMPPDGGDRRARELLGRTVAAVAALG